MKTRSLILGVTGFALGVVIHSFGWMSPALFCVIILLAGVLLLFSLLGVSHKKISFLVFIAVIGIAVGMGWFEFQSSFRIVSPEITEQIDREIHIEGIICGEPDERDNHVKVVLCELMVDGKTREDSSSRVLITTEKYPTLQYGDKVAVLGVVSVPGEIKDVEREKVFDYAAYLRKDSIDFVMYRPEVELLDRGLGNPVKHILFSVKQKFLANISVVIHEPYVSLLGGLVVGAKQALGEDLLEAFRITGVIHIVVLSGYNVTIVAEALMRFFAFLPKRSGLVIGAVSIVLFAIMTGAGATIVRASIMALLVVLARAIGREFDITRALLIAAFVMMLHNPYIVVFDPSFQLSFLATVGLIYVAPLIEKYLLFLPRRFGLREIASATIATQIFVLPAILYMMGELSIVAVLVNLLILLFIPITMLFGFITGMLGFISRTASIPFAFVTFLLLFYELKIVEWFAVLPFASITVKHFSFMWVIVIYICYMILLYMFHHPMKHQLRTTSKTRPIENA